MPKNVKKFTPSAEEVQSVMLSDASIGWCRECGAEHSCVEPDASNYKCESCGENEVYGCEEFVIRGWVNES